MIDRDEMRAKAIELRAVRQSCLDNVGRPEAPESLAVNIHAAQFLRDVGEFDEAGAAYLLGRTVFDFVTYRIANGCSPALDRLLPRLFNPSIAALWSGRLSALACRDPLPGSATMFSRIDRGSDRKPSPSCLG